ncbi:hypothetical protein Hanom_Chr14g01328011 [Helianthus anomalus]
MVVRMIPMVVRMMKWMPWLTFWCWCCNRFGGVWAGCFHSWEVALEVFDKTIKLRTKSTLEDDEFQPLQLDSNSFSFWLLSCVYTYFLV